VSQAVGARFLQPLADEIRFESVTWHSDDGTQAPSLKGLDLVIPAGETTALLSVDPREARAVAWLLARFIDPHGGRVVIDGQDIASTSLESLRKNISVVSQEPFLFNGTIGENIAYGNLDADAEKITEAAQAANCFEFISELAESFDTRVGERGVRLSVGEKQRISIARALLKDSPILILDEATASVDTATERLIQQALERLMTGRTTFVIAHRLSTIRDANQILVLKNGRITERGTHDELVRQQGLYARLARIQNTTFIEESFAKLEPAT